MDLTGRSEGIFRETDGSSICTQTPNISSPLKYEFLYSSPNAPMHTGRDEFRRFGQTFDGGTSLSLPNRRWLADRGLNQHTPSAPRSRPLRSKVASAQLFRRSPRKLAENRWRSGSLSPTSRSSERLHRGHNTRKGIEHSGILEPPQFKLGKTPARQHRFEWNSPHDQNPRGGDPGIAGRPRAEPLNTDEFGTIISEPEELSLPPGPAGSSCLSNLNRPDLPHIFHNSIPPTKRSDCSSHASHQELADASQDESRLSNLAVPKTRLPQPVSRTQKRRQYSATLPDSKRIRSPTKAIPTPSHPAFSRLPSNHGSPQIPSHVAGLQFNHRTRMGNDHRQGDFSSSSAEDGSSGTRHFVLPGDPPIPGPIRRQDPVDRRYTTSPRSLIRIFENVKKLTNEMRQQAFMSQKDENEYGGRPGMLPHSDDSSQYWPCHPQAKTDATRSSRLPVLRATGTAKEDCHSGSRSRGCISSREHTTQNVRPHSSGGSTGISGSIGHSERGFIGGYKLMQRLQRGSDSDSDKNRRPYRLNLPRSREDLPRTEQQQGQEDDAIELELIQSYTAHQAAPHAEIREHARQSSEVVRTPSSSGVQDLIDRTDATHQESPILRGSQRDAHEPGHDGAKASQSESVDTLEARSLNQTSGSTTEEPLTPIDGAGSNIPAAGRSSTVELKETDAVGKVSIV